MQRAILTILFAVPIFFALWGARVALRGLTSAEHAELLPMVTMIVPALGLGFLISTVFQREHRPWRLVFRPRWSRFWSAALLLLATPPFSAVGIPVFWVFVLPNSGHSRGDYAALIAGSAVFWIIASYLIGCLIFSAFHAKPARFFAFFLAACLGHLAVLGTVGLGTL